MWSGPIFHQHHVQNLMQKWIVSTIHSKSSYTSWLKVIWYLNLHKWEIDEMVIELEVATSQD